jgi:hypothetical protein
LANRPGLGNRPIDINNRPININRPTTINRPVNIAVGTTLPWGAGTGWRYPRPGWTAAGAAWAASRPWNYGWYAGPTAWNWWNTANTVAWGITGLAAATSIITLVSNAIDNNQDYIAVPSTNYQLAYGSVQPQGTNVTFNYTDSGQTLTVNADCQNGLLNGTPPATPEQAQLLNAACQVAFGQ